MNITTPITTTSAVTKPKQYTCGISENLKTLLGELRQDFTRPAAVKNAPPVLMSEKEALEMLHKVASDRRFSTKEETNEDGESHFQTIDLFENAWNTIKDRDYVETSTSTPSIDKMIAQMTKYGKSLNLTQDVIDQMVATARAGVVATA